MSVTASQPVGYLSTGTGFCLMVIIITSNSSLLPTLLLLHSLPAPPNPKYTLCGFSLERSDRYLSGFFLFMDVRLASRHHQAHSLIICLIDHLWNQLVALRFFPLPNPQCLASSQTLMNRIFFKGSAARWPFCREVSSELGTTCLGFEVQTHLGQLGVLIHQILLTLGTVFFLVIVAFQTLLAGKPGNKARTLSSSAGPSASYQGCQLNGDF